LNLNEQAVVCANDALERGFTPPSFPEAMALLHSEVSEAFEDWRSGHDVREIRFEGNKPCGVPIELADLMIRLLHYSNIFNIDLDTAYKEKLEYNRTRPFRHGGKRA